MVVISNKPSRVENVISVIDELVSSRTIEPKQAASLKGKLTFMEGQHWNRILNMSMRTLSFVAEQAGGNHPVGDLLIEELLLAKECILSAKPRIIPAKWPEGEILVSLMEHMNQVKIET